MNNHYRIVGFLIAALSVLVGSRSGASTLPGDYNFDNRVDAADYTVWRDSLGATGLGLAADGNRDGVVNQADYHIWRGGEPGITNHRTNAAGINATGSNYGSNALTDGSRVMASVYQTGQLGGFSDSFFISAAPVSLAQWTTFFRADAVFAAVNDRTNYSFLDDIRLFVWDRSVWVEGEPLPDNAVAISNPLNFGSQNPSSKPALFGGTSSPNTPGEDFENLQYRLISGTFSPLTLPPGDYMVGLLSGNVLSFELAQSYIPKTGNILPGDRYFDYPRWYNYLGTYLYETDPEFTGTLALDLYYRDYSGGFGASLPSSAATSLSTVPEPSSVVLMLIGVLATFYRRVPKQACSAVINGMARVLVLSCVDVAPWMFAGAAVNASTLPGDYNLHLGKFASGNTQLPHRRQL